MSCNCEYYVVSPSGVKWCAKFGLLLNDSLLKEKCKKISRTKGSA